MSLPVPSYILYQYRSKRCMCNNATFLPRGVPFDPLQYLIYLEISYTIVQESSNCKIGG